LWEFAHLQTGDPAIRSDDGRLSITEATGLVFVLIPAGTFSMGAQSADASQPNFDPQATKTESPVHQVTLSSYFLSKYEMTQGQWVRLTGRNPSSYGPSSEFNGRRHDLTHPVEQVTWTGCMELMARLGLDLPSEAQWEYGCRAGSDTPWWTGADRESLRGNVNLADQTAKKAGATWSSINDWPDLEDGWAVHAPVGSFTANAFGLHEVHGNVWEWCLDGYANYSTAAQTDPVSPWAGAQPRVFRGGGFFDAASRARSAIRDTGTPESQFSSLGLRPARASRLSASQLHPPGK
jgi:formylglycine-generating enzyme required for sulfatase activity